MPTELPGVPGESYQQPANAFDPENAAPVTAQEDPAAVIQQPILTSQEFQNLDDATVLRPVQPQDDTPTRRVSTRIKTQTKQYDASSGTWK